MISKDMYNAEGHKDTTPYLAMKSKDKVKGDHFPGDIVEWEAGNGGIKQAVILSVHMRNVTALELFDTDVEENSHKVMSRTLMYCDAGRMIVLWNNRITGLVKTMEDDAYDNLLTHVGRILGCTKVVTETVTERVEIPVEKVVEVSTEKADIKTITRLETERDLYKDLYTDLVTKMMTKNQ